MKGFAGFTRRNLLVYFKDRQAVIFSLLTSIIVFCLYMLFIKNSYVTSMTEATKGLEAFVGKKEIEMLVNGILLVGIMGSAMITVPYNCLCTIVQDRERKIDYDISATPLKRPQIILAYFTASALSSIIMTGIILTVGLIAISCMSDMHLTVKGVAAAYGLVVVGSVSATAIFMILIQFFKSVSASGAFFGILSAASGFVIGAYVPLSEFSDTIQSVCNLFPATHVTVLLKRALLENALTVIDDKFGGMTLPGFTDGTFSGEMRKTFTFTSVIGGHTFTTAESLAYIGAATVLGIVLMILVYRKTYKRK